MLDLLPRASRSICVDMTAGCLLVQDASSLCMAMIGCVRMAKNEIRDVLRWQLLLGYRRDLYVMGGCGLWAVSSVQQIAPILVNMCQTASKSASDGPVRDLGPNGPGTRWHRAFCLQSSHIRQHAATQEHQLYVAAYFAPDLPRHTFFQKIFKDDDLLHGAVPRLDAWLRIWRMCRNPQSWSHAEQAFETEHCINAIREFSVQIKGAQHMVLLLRELVRERKRTSLQACNHISYSWDDRDGYMFLRFRCDVPPTDSIHCRTAWGYSRAQDVSEKKALQLCRCSGVVGIGQAYVGKTIEELTDDAAVQISEDVLAMLRDCCTPVGGSFM